MPTPPPQITGDLLHLMSDWSGVNVLMLDQEQVVAEKNQEPFFHCLKE
jgi:glycine amidinotransferase